MVKSIAVQNSVPWDDLGKNYISVTTIDFAVDPVWTVQLQGNFQIVPRNVNWRFALLDNVEGSSVVIINFGDQYTLSMPPGARQTFPIPNTVNFLQFSGLGDAVNLILSEAQISPNTDNFAPAFVRSNLMFPITPINASRVMTVSDFQKKLVFTPVTNMNYSLLPAASVPNGTPFFVQNYTRGDIPNTGFNVFFLPSGSDTINNWWNTGIPTSNFQLSPGDSGFMVSDGLSNWNFQGKLSKYSADRSTTDLSFFVHDLGRQPDVIQRWLRNVIADGPYTPGDIVRQNLWDSNDPVQSMRRIVSMPYNVTNVTSQLIPNNVGTPFAITLANWVSFIKVQVNW